MKRVFSRSSSIAIAAASASVVMLFIAIVPNIPLIKLIGVSDLMSFAYTSQVIETLFTSLLYLPSSSLLYIVSISILTGINIAMLIFYVRMYRSAPTGITLSSGVIGTIGAVLGFGCAACGSIFLGALLTTLGGTSVLAALPYAGAEIGAISMIAIVVSILLLRKYINTPPVCPI